jgi:hypothetical protein
MRRVHCPAIRLRLTLTCASTNRRLCVPSHKRPRSFCSCGVRGSHKRRYNRWGFLLLYQEENSQAIDSRDCEYTGFDELESSRVICATYFGLGSVLKRAIRITLSRKHGAGGASMSAGLICYSVVNSKTVPVFRLMMVLNTALRRSGSSLDSRDVGALFGECTSRIRHLYRTGKAGPNDLTP